MQILSMKCIIFSNSLTNSTHYLTYNYRFPIVFLGENPSFAFDEFSW